MRSQSVLVLGCAPPTPHGLDQMRRLCVQARRRGLYIVGADTLANLATFDRSLADDVVAADVHSMGVVAELAHLRGKVDAVLTFRELSVEPAATVADAFGLPGISPSTAHTLRNKDLCRAALREAGFVQPEVLLTNEREEAVAFLDKTSPGPWIVKPRDGMGSAQVHRVADADSLDDALTSRPAETPVLIETLVTGREMSVEGFVLNGTAVPLCVTEKRVGPRFVEIGHRIPGLIEPAERTLVEDQLARACSVLEMTRGFFHVEFWLTSDDLVFGEFHARPGGGFIPTMLEYARPGLELYGSVLNDLLGIEVPEAPALSRAGGVDYLIAGERGRVAAVSGWPGISSEPGVLASHLFITVGDSLKPVCDSADRHAVVVVGADAAATVEATLARIRSRVRVLVEDESGSDITAWQWPDPHDRQGAAK